MNYILEIKAFYDWLELNQLHTPAIALWHALMHMANKTGWQDNFTVAVVVLTIKTGLNKQAVLRARNELKEKGLIDFRTKDNQAAVYSVKSFLQSQNDRDFVTANETANGTANETANDTANGTANDTANDTINKQNKTKQNETKEIIKDSCTEPEQTVSVPPAVIALLLNDKTEHFVSHADIDTWRELYPAVDIMQELRNMRGWLLSNPTKRKTKRGIARFINSWLAKEQNRGGVKGGTDRTNISGAENASGDEGNFGVML